MSIQPQVTLRSRKLGVLIRDARLAARKSIAGCAHLAGVKPGIYRAWEEGRRSPSLPELEILAFGLKLPLRHFWSKEATSDDEPVTDELHLTALSGIRQRLIGALLRKEREKTSISLGELSDRSGIPARRLKSYEMGDRSIPLPELEGLISLLNGQIESFFDRSGPIGLWMNQQKAVQDYLLLPAELQDFVSKPINRPYLELALKLSGMSTEKLRSVAENLLDITL
jgi:transcriptional regulator with XRE-family HTH domain